jgi:hypothetical protein
MTFLVIFCFSKSKNNTYEFFNLGLEGTVNRALSDVVDAQPETFSRPSNQPIIVNIEQTVVKKIPAPQKPQSDAERFIRAVFAPQPAQPPPQLGYYDMMGRKSELHKCRNCEHEVKIQIYKII